MGHTRCCRRKLDVDGIKFVHSATARRTPRLDTRNRNEDRERSFFGLIVFNE